MDNFNKRLFFFFVFLFGYANSQAQKGINGLINAEKSFAAYSVAHSTKEAFLKYLDSTGIVFDNGKPVNGIETWNKRERRPGVLNWVPQFAEISASGDFGYTTGPWTFQNSSNDTVIARGQYTTVWHIDKNGEWKFLVDLGVNGTPANLISEVKKVSAAKITNTAIEHVSSFGLAENDFIKLYSIDKAKAYKRYLSPESIINRNGNLPAISSADQMRLIDLTPASIQYTMNGIQLAGKEDLGYVYGTTIIKGKTENYLRIWRREKEGWKIALEVLRY